MPTLSFNSTVKLFFAGVIGVERDGFAVGIDDGPPVVALDDTLPVFGGKAVLERIASIAKATAIPIPIPTKDFLFNLDPYSSLSFWI